MAGSYSDEKQALLKRLRRVEGQVRGVQRMIEEDQYCVDVLVQIAAIRAALNKVGMVILERHTRGCVLQALKEDKGDEAVDELMAVLGRFMNDPAWQAGLQGVETGGECCGSRD